MDGVDNVLRSKFFRAENLPKMDSMGGKCDPFVEVKYGTHKNKTSVIKGTLSPDWYEELQIPVILPTVAGILYFLQQKICLTKNKIVYT